MRGLAHGMLAPICLCTATLAGAEETPAGATPVAVISELSGTAWVTPRGRERHRLETFDWLSEGSKIDLDGASSLTLAFVTGTRFRLEKDASAVLGDTDLELLDGESIPLASVPPMPRLGSVTTDAPPGERAAAIRIRGSRIRGLYPQPPARVTAGQARLWFEPSGDATGYTVEVRDPRGSVVFTTDTTASELTLPPDVLEPATSYDWVVKTIPVQGASISGEGGFTTLSAEDALRRERLRAALTNDVGAEALALLAAVDRRLGLFAEARRELEAALRKAPDNEAIRRELEELEEQLTQ